MITDMILKFYSPSLQGILLSNAQTIGKRWIHLPARWLGIPSEYLNPVVKKGPQGHPVAARERDILKQRKIYIYIYIVQ